MFVIGTYVTAKTVTKPSTFADYIHGNFEIGGK